MKPTPPFVSWTLAKPCELRDELHDPLDPDQVERQLRSLRAIREAHVDGRLVDDLCFQQRPDAISAAADDAMAFRWSEVAKGHGFSLEELPCHDCNANPLQSGVSVFARLAGCCGWLICEEDFVADCQAYLDNTTGAYSQLFPPTNPRWYGLWIDASWNSSQAKYGQDMLLDSSRRRATSTEQKEFIAAVECALETEAELHVTYHPAGTLDGSSWLVPAHCSRCGAIDACDDRTDDRIHCGVCGHTARPRPLQRRHAKGDRPFWLLSRFLGAKAAAERLDEYRATSS